VTETNKQTKKNKQAKQKTNFIKNCCRNKKNRIINSKDSKFAIKAKSFGKTIQFLNAFEKFDIDNKS